MRHSTKIMGVKHHQHVLMLPFPPNLALERRDPFPARGDRTTALRAKPSRET